MVQIAMQRVDLCQAGHAAFSMSSEVGRNICAPQGLTDHTWKIEELVGQE